MTDKIKAYMNRRNVYTLIEKWAEEGEEFFYADNIKDNIGLEYDEIYQQIEDLLNLGVITIKYVIENNDGLEIYEDLNSIPKYAFIDGKKYHVTEEEIFMRFYFADDFAKIMQSRK